MQSIFEKRAKLVGSKDKGMLWLLNTCDDWIHDQYGESYIYYGTIYSKKPFHPLSTAITGYFQDEDSSRWIKINNGVAIFKPNAIDAPWKKQLEDFLQISFQTGVYRIYKKSSLNKRKMSVSQL